MKLRRAGPAKEREELYTKGAVGPHQHIPQEWNMQYGTGSRGMGGHKFG